MISFAAIALGTPLSAQGLGCFAAERLEDRPVSSLSLYIFHNASRQGHYVTLQVTTPDGAFEILAPCPTDRACIAPCEGGVLAIEETDAGIEVTTDRFLLDCNGPDLGNGTLIPERYQLVRENGAECGGPG